MADFCYWLIRGSLIIARFSARRKGGRLICGTAYTRVYTVSKVYVDLYSVFICKHLTRSVAEHHRPLAGTHCVNLDIMTSIENLGNPAMTIDQAVISDQTTAKSQASHASFLHWCQKRIIFFQEATYANTVHYTLCSIQK